MGKVKAVTWFTTMKGTIGIALTENDMGEEKGRIMQVEGDDANSDIVAIGEYGTEFPLEEAKALCDKHGNPCNVEY